MRKIVFSSKLISVFHPTADISSVTSVQWRDCLRGQRCLHLLAHPSRAPNVSPGLGGIWAATQAGPVNNLNDGLAWGLFPLIFAAAGLGLDQIGLLAGLYPAVWGVSQLLTGGISESIGRKWLIACGMWTQAGELR